METKLPRINHWTELVEETPEMIVFAAFAERCWEHVPRYSVFAIVLVAPELAWWRWSRNSPVFADLDKRLEEFEHKLVGYLGRGFAKKWALEAESGCLITLRNGQLISQVQWQ